MRLASAIVLVGTVACGERPPPAAAPGAPAPAAAPGAPTPRAPEPPERLELAVADEPGVERPARWTEQLAIRENPNEDIGVFAYARRKTVLRVADAAVGWLEPGARVGVGAVARDRVDVVLFAWGASSLHGRVRAWVEARDLGPAPPRDAPPFSRATRPERLVRRGQDLRRLDGAELGYTFCGPVEVLGEDARGVHVVQREDGVALEVRLRKNPSWESHACPGLLFQGDGHGGLDVTYHDRRRAYHGAALPPGIVESGPFEGPTFGQLVARRARIYWLVDDRNAGPTCEEWQLAPPKPGSDYGEMISRTRLDDGDTLVVRYSMMYGPDADAGVTLLGPSSEVIAPPGRQPQSSGISFGCGAQYGLVANAGGVLTMHTDPPALGGRVRAYDPGDTERWYTDRARCQRDAESRRRQVALAFQPHQGC
jgi:hypothetical protein